MDLPRSMQRDLLTRIEDPRLTALLGYWLELFRSGGIPPRRRIDPGRLKAALPMVWICDYSAIDDRFVVRLVGAQVERMYRDNIVGRSMQDLYSPDQWPVVAERMLRLVREPCILYLSGAIYGFSGGTGRGERLMLPLASDGQTVDGGHRRLHLQMG